MARMVVDTNYLQTDELRHYLDESPRNKVVVTPLVELEMLKGDAPVNVIKSAEILAEHAKRVVLTKEPLDVVRLRGRRKSMKKRLSSGKRTATFRKWSRHTRERAKRGAPDP
ncbi:histone H3/H4 [Bradyrhizobium sp. USDA 4501]